MDAKVDLNNNDCVKQVNNIRTTKYVNICTGQEATVNNGTLDIMLLSALLLVVIAGIGLVS